MWDFLKREHSFTKASNLLSKQFSLCTFTHISILFHVLMEPLRENSKVLWKDLGPWILLLNKPSSPWLTNIASGRVSGSQKKWSAQVLANRFQAVTLKHVNQFISKTEHKNKYINSLLHKNVPPTYMSRNVSERYNFQYVPWCLIHSYLYSVPKLVSVANRKKRRSYIQWLLDILIL